MKLLTCEVPSGLPACVYLKGAGELTDVQLPAYVYFKGAGELTDVRLPAYVYFKGAGELTDVRFEPSGSHPLFP